MAEYRAHEQNLRLSQQMLEQQGQINNLTKERDSLGREADRLRSDWTAMRERAERAEAVIARVQALADEYPAGLDTALIHAALDQPTEAS